MELGTRIASPIINHWVAETYGRCAESNARRIVASVNACADYSTDALENMHFPIRKEFELMREQRDELLAALKECLECEFPVFDKETIEKSRTAIAKAEAELASYKYQTSNTYHDRQG